MVHSKDDILDPLRSTPSVRHTPIVGKRGPQYPKRLIVYVILYLNVLLFHIFMTFIYSTSLDLHHCPGRKFACGHFWKGHSFRGAVTMQLVLRLLSSLSVTCILLWLDTSEVDHNFKTTDNKGRGEREGGAE